MDPLVASSGILHPWGKHEWQHTGGTMHAGAFLEGLVNVVFAAQKYTIHIKKKNCLIFFFFFFSQKKIFVMKVAFACTVKICQKQRISRRNGPKSFTVFGNSQNIPSIQRGWISLCLMYFIWITSLSHSHHFTVLANSFWITVLLAHPAFSELICDADLCPFHERAMIFLTRSEWECAFFDILVVFFCFFVLKIVNWLAQKDSCATKPPRHGQELFQWLELMWMFAFHSSHPFENNRKN